MHAPHIDGLYVHVPFCDGKCGYCGFYSVRYEPALAAAWLRAIGAEKAAIEREYGPLAPRTVYFGGGTPTQLSTDELKRLAEIVGGASAQEWTAEANPGSVEAAKLRALRSAGVNRVSLGVQALDDRVLTALGRRHTVRDTRAAVDALRSSGFDNWGLDLIACVPGVAVEAWRDTVAAAVEMEPRHVSVYALTREEGSALARRLEAGTARLLDDEDQLAMLDAAEAILCRAGFGRYEISNYAQPGFECRHNVACWRGGNYAGLGCAASSRVGAVRWTNRPDIHGYVEALDGGRRPPRDEDPLSPSTDAMERLVFGLRMAEGVSLGGIVADLGLAGSAAERHWRKTLAALRVGGLVAADGDRWRLTKRGREMADHVAVELVL
jgi:oxygen-independent coproporphyrinogen-3 oxidase